MRIANRRVILIGLFTVVVLLSEAHSPAAANGQTVLVVQEGPGKVILFSADKPSQRKITKVGGKPHEIELTPDGRTAFVSNFGLLEVNLHVGTPGTTISVLDVEHGIERTRFRLPVGATAPHGLKLRPPAYRELFTNTEVGDVRMIVFDASSGRVLRSFALAPGVHNFVFDADGTALFAFTTTDRILRIDSDGGTVTGSVTVKSPRGLAWDAAKNRLIVGGKNELLMLDPATLSVASRFADLGVGQIFYPAVTPDGQWILAPAVLDGVVLLVDARTGAVARRIETGSPLQAIPNEKRAWVSNVLVPQSMLGANAKPRNGGVILVDLGTSTTKLIYRTPTESG